MSCFSGNDDLIAIERFFLQDITDQFFWSTFTVNIGSINQIDPIAQRRPHNFLAFFFI